MKRALISRTQMISVHANYTLVGNRLLSPSFGPPLCRKFVTQTENPEKGPSKIIFDSKNELAGNSAHSDSNGQDFRERGQNRGSRIVLYGVLVAFLVLDIYYVSEHLKQPKRNILLPNEFTLCDILSIEQVSPTTKYFRLKCKNSVSGCSHVYIKDDSCQIGRAYTPVTSSPDEIGLLIRHVPGGIISNLMNELKKGDTVHLRGPFETIPKYQPNAVKDLVLIAAGTGITPFYQLLKQILSENQDSTNIMLYYCNRNKDEVLLKRELDLLQAGCPRLKIVFALDDPVVGYQKTLDVQNLNAKLPKGKDVALLVCGPDGFVAKVAGPKLENDQGPLGGILKDLGYLDPQVLKL